MIQGRKHDHIGIASNNMEETVKWYVDVLGFELYGGCVATDGTPCKFIANQGINIEIYEVKDTSAIISGKLDHLAFVSDDIEEDYKYCLQQGMECITDGIVDVPDAWERGCRYFKIKSVSGEDIEFVQTL